MVQPVLQPGPWVGFFRIEEFYNVFMWRFEALGTYTIASLWSATTPPLPLQIMPNQFQISIIAGRVSVSSSTLSWAPAVTDPAALPAGQPIELHLAAVDSYGVPYTRLNPLHQSLALQPDTVSDTHPKRQTQPLICRS